MARSSSTLTERARWARIAYQLDQEFASVAAPIAMLDGESVADWRARNRAAIEASLACRSGQCYDCATYGGA